MLILKMLNIRYLLYFTVVSQCPQKLSKIWVIWASFCGHFPHTELTFQVYKCTKYRLSAPNRHKKCSGKKGDLSTISTAMNSTLLYLIPTTPQNVIDMSTRYFDIQNNTVVLWEKLFWSSMVLGERKPTEKLDRVGHRHVSWSWPILPPRRGGWEVSLRFLPQFIELLISAWTVWLLVPYRWLNQARVIFCEQYPRWRVWLV